MGGPLPAHYLGLYQICISWKTCRSVKVVEEFLIVDHHQVEIILTLSDGRLAPLFFLPFLRNLDPFQLGNAFVQILRKVALDHQLALPTLLFSGGLRKVLGHYWGTRAKQASVGRAASLSGTWAEFNVQFFKRDIG